MLFHYKALKNGKTISKTIEATNQDALLQYLKNNGYFPINIHESGAASGSIIEGFFNRVTFTDIVNLTRQLAIMLNAGLTLVDSFDILKKQITKSPLLSIIEDIDKEIRAGNSFSSSLKKYPQHFPHLYIALVKSGEASGKLNDILLKLSDNMEKTREFQGKIKGALIYPVVVISAMFVVMFIMITFVVPKLLDLYKDFAIDLPITTKILIAVSGFFSHFWPFIIVGTFLGLAGARSFLQTKQGKFLFDSNIIRMPVIGEIIKISALVDSTRTLSILIQSGVSILEGLNIIIDVTGNVIYQNAFKNVYKKVEKGSSIGEAMSREHIFPPILIQMTIVGEQTGHLDETLMRISRYFEMESELAVKAMTSLIEPAILVVLGVGVAFLVMSVITPIYNLTSSFK